MDSDWKAGLEDVIAARSGVCTIDGGAGRLYYRGYEIGDLAGAVPFEDVTRLLWDGELPTAAEARAFRTQLAEARVLPAPLVALLRGLPRECHPLDALRTAKPHDLTVRYEALPEHHNTIFAVAALQAFRTVFASAIRIGWFADPWSVAQGGTGARLRQRLRNRFPGLF